MIFGAGRRKPTEPVVLSCCLPHEVPQPSFLKSRLLTARTSQHPQGWHCTSVMATFPNNYRSVMSPPSNENRSGCGTFLDYTFFHLSPALHGHSYVLTYLGLLFLPCQPLFPSLGFGSVLLLFRFVIRTVFHARYHTRKQYHHPHRAPNPLIMFAA